MVPDPEIDAILAPLTAPVVANEKLLVLSPVIGSVKVAVYCTVEALVMLDDTSVIELIVVGCATAKVPDGPAPISVFPARSVEVAAASVMPILPVPLIAEMVTVLVSPVPLTATLPVAVPVVFSVIFEVLNVLVLKLASA